MSEQGRPPAMDPRLLAALTPRPVPPPGPPRPAPPLGAPRPAAPASNPESGPAEDPGSSLAGASIPTPAEGSTGVPADGPASGDVRPEFGQPSSAAPDRTDAGTPATGAQSGGPTGHPQVDAALADLAQAERLTPDQQIATYESVHRTLQDTLRSIEQN